MSNLSASSGELLATQQVGIYTGEYMTQKVTRQCKQSFKVWAWFLTEAANTPTSIQTIGCSLTSRSSFKIDSLMVNDGKLRSGIGANQSVSTDKTLCSMNANCKSCFRSCDNALCKIDTLFVAGLPSWFILRSSCKYEWKILEKKWKSKGKPNWFQKQRTKVNSWESNSESRSQIFVSYICFHSKSQRYMSLTKRHFDFQQPYPPHFWRLWRQLLANFFNFPYLI